MGADHRETALVCHIHEVPLHLHGTALLGEFLDKDGAKGERGLHDPFGLIEALFGGNIIEHLHGRPFRGGYSCIKKEYRT
jgi:hypothetical protein